MANLILRANGALFANWQSIDVLQSIDAATNQFTLTVKTGSPVQIAAGAPVQLEYEGQRVLTGYIDALINNYDSQQWQQQLVGRSKAADIVDCSTEGMEFKPMRLDAIARQLLQPFGIDVVLNTTIEPLKKSHNIAAAENIWCFLEKLAAYSGVLLYSDNNGAVVIDRVGARSSETILKLGVNILSASNRCDVSQRFSDYIVCGDADMSAWNGNSDISRRGHAKDKHVLRHRPCVIQSDSSTDIASCERQAIWQRNTNFGRGQSITYTVHDWIDDQGKLWQPNTRVFIDDYFSNVQERRLISDVRYILDEKRGKISELTVQPPEAFTINQLPEPAGTGGTW